jgi:hypothetical protein
MWIHERLDIGRPKTDLSEYKAAADGTDPADLPTMSVTTRPGKYRTTA